MRTFEWEPEIEVVRFESSDIITTSGGWETDEDELPPLPPSIFG